MFLQRKSRELVDNEELQKLWFLLEEHKVGQMVGDENMINFKNFQKVAELAGEKCALFFTAVTFFKLYQGDYDGRISIMQFFNYVMRKVWLQQTRIGINSTVFRICVLVKLTTLTALILM